MPVSIVSVLQHQSSMRSSQTPFKAKIKDYCVRNFLKTRFNDHNDHIQTRNVTRGIEIRLSLKPAASDVSQSRFKRLNIKSDEQVKARSALSADDSGWWPAMARNLFDDELRSVIRETEISFQAEVKHECTCASDRLDNNSPVFSIFAFELMWTKNGSYDKTGCSLKTDAENCKLLLHVVLLLAGSYHIAVQITKQ